MNDLITYLRTAFVVYNWILFGRIMLSWVAHDPNKPFFRAVYVLTDPILMPFRRMFGGRSAIDFSPLIAIVVLQIVENLIIQFLSRL